MNDKENDYGRFNRITDGIYQSNASREAGGNERNLESDKLLIRHFNNCGFVSNRSNIIATVFTEPTRTLI